MPYDIYGNNLRNGFCEVHPYVEQEYPCQICCQEIEREEQRQRENREHSQLQNEQYHLHSALHQIEKLEAEKKELLHFLKYFKQCVEDEDFIMVNNTDEGVVDNVLSKMNSLIQKHK